MARIGKASVPLDLMTYSADDGQPSEFLLQESPRQTILTVFNWSDKPRAHSVSLAAAGLHANAGYQLTDVLGNQSCCAISAGSIDLKLAPHSVAVLKLVDDSIPASAPQISANVPQSGIAGQALAFSALAAPASTPVLNFHWDFGDGVALDGAAVQHAYTHAGQYSVKLSVTGIDGAGDLKTLPIQISGEVNTRFIPEQKRRPE